MNRDATTLSKVIADFVSSETPRKKKLKEKVFAKGELAEITSQFPSDWYIADLIDVTHLITCGVAKRPEYVEDGIPFLSAQNARPFKANLNKIKYIGQEAFEKLTVGGKPEKNDVLYTRVGNCGEAAKVEFDFDFAIYVSLTLIKPYRNLLNTDFLVAFLNSQFGLSQAAQGAIGIGLKNLNVDNVRRYIIPLPPLAEQKVIADKLDSLLAQVETTKARLDRVPDILKRFRQSVLAAAVSGRLTEEWATTEKVLSDVCDFQNGYAFKSGWFSDSGVFQVIKLGNIRDGVLALENSPAYIDEVKATEFSRFSPKKGDTLISMTGTRFKKDYGFGCLVYDEQSLLINQRVGRLIPNKALITPEYLNIFIRSELFREQFFVGETGGVNQGNVGSKHIMSINIDLPSANTQKYVVRRVQELFAFADAVEAKAQAATERVNKLTQSILSKAFRGELTADWRAANPDLISGENSAEALLEKIKAEREALKPKKKARAKKVKKV